jgi:F420H(2)-dependent quinone reductase
MSVGYAQRTVYRKPGWLRRQVNRAVAWLAGVGLTPANTVRLEVRGRKTGRVRAFAVTTATWQGEQYLVSLAGESDWVRNLRAADGNAVIRHGYRNRVRTEEIAVQQRASLLSAYLEKRALSKSPSRAARDYFGVGPYPTPEELEPLADRYPVFKVAPAG